MSQRVSTGGPGGATEPSLGELVSDLARDIQNLFRQEVALAKTEATQAAKTAGMAVAQLVVGGLVLYAGLLFLLLAAVFGLRELDLPWSLSALIVAVVVLVIGAILVQRARANLSAQNLAPTETIETLREDRDWVKGQVQ